MPGPPTARGTPGCPGRCAAAGADRESWRGLQIVVPQVDVDGVAGRGVGAPQLARGEPHAVDVLRPGALPGCVRIREDEHAVVDRDLAAPAAHVARQPGVADRVEV